MRLFGSLTVILLFFSSARGQEYYTNFREYGSRDGFNAFDLSGNVAKDKTGFLWIGSDNGLYRFDGQNFKAFLHDPADSLSLPSDNAANIFIERNGTFWVTNAVNGISQFDPVTQKFHAWRNTNLSEIDISKENVNSIFQDSKDRLWFILAGQGLAYVNKQHNTLQVFSFYHDPKNPTKWMSTAYLNNVAEDKNHMFWISSNAGLIHFNPETKIFHIYGDTTHGKINESRHASINYVYAADDGMIWTGTWGAGLKKFDPKNKRWETYLWDLQYIENSSKNIAIGITQKSKTQLWVATFDGLMLFDIAAKKFAKVVSINAKTASNVSGTRLFDDGLGNVWCSGLKPLTKLETKNNIFHFQPIKDNTIYGSGHVFCNTFLNDPEHGLLYIGTYFSKGLYTMDHQTGEIINYPLIKNKLVFEGVNQLLLDREKKLWVCFNVGVRIFNLQSKQFEFISPSVKNASFLNLSVSAAVEDDEGNIWFASRAKGLLLYDKKLKEILVFLPNKGKMPNEIILSLFKDSKGNIWVGYRGKSGIACIPKNGGDVRFYNYTNLKIAQNDIGSICESKEGDIFFSLHIYGLGQIKSPGTGKDSFKLYTNNQGLAGNKVLGIVKDKQQNLWISTNNGMSVCHTATMKFRNFTEADGLRSNSTDATLYCDASGTVYMGTTGGFQTSDPEVVESNKVIPPVIIHSFKINGKEYDGDINVLKKISLAHNEANFSFEFVALTFTNNEHIKYAYRLKGLDKEWRFTDKQRIAAYSIAHGGMYTLQIKAANEAGNWNEEPYELIIQVKPPFWETWWFIVLCILSAGLLVFWITRRRIKMIRTAEERKTYINKIKAESEMKALRAQMNPHFIFNCMNTIDAHIHKNDTDAASEFLHKFSRLIRQVLENSQYPVISIQKDMEALNLYIELEEQRHDFKFTHAIILPGQLIQKGYKIPPLLVQPYVENAILHGLRHKENGAGLLTITFEEKENQLVCLVEDNGIGRKASAFIYDQRKQNHQSMGLKVTSDRIESLNDLYKGVSEVVIIDKEDGAGTIVKLIFPKIAESE
ncbi:MAG: two-component regulator propeller domain-containing protein [Ferruginibacter sp.]